MTNPVPGFRVDTPFHKRGKHWSCHAVRGADGVKRGLHTGVDIPAPAGTTVVAARAGVTAHVDFGKDAFGRHQLVVRCSDGTQDFYAHMSSRVTAGKKVAAGQPIGKVGAEGNVTGPHLHFERHSSHAVRWSCGIIANPKPSLDATSAPAPSPGARMPAPRVLLSKLKFGQRDSDSVKRLQAALNRHRHQGDPAPLPVTGNYLEQTDRAVRLCQQRHNLGADPAGKSFVGARQAKHLFGAGVEIEQ